MNTEDGAKLYDVCPHVSDSVRWLHPRSLGSVGAHLLFLSPGLCRSGARASRQRAGGWPQTDCHASARAFLEGGVVYQKV